MTDEYMKKVLSEAEKYLTMKVCEKGYFTMEDVDEALFLTEKAREKGYFTEAELYEVLHPKRLVTCGWKDLNKDYCFGESPFVIEEN